VPRKGCNLSSEEQLGFQPLGLQSWGTLGWLWRGPGLPSGPAARGVEHLFTGQSGAAAPGSEWQVSAFW